MTIEFITADEARAEIDGITARYPWVPVFCDEDHCEAVEWSRETYGPDGARACEKYQEMRYLLGEDA